jgi:peptidoglycan-N-acetylglucosamine deacetylase
MLSTLILVLAGLYVPSFSQTEGPRTKPHRAVAVTFDDLPYVAAGRDPYLPHAQRATSQILRVLKAHRAPAIGFVNENKLHAPGELDRRVALLQQWIDAGMMLGNHTYSHPDFNRLTVQQFQDEIIKGEIITRRLMHSRQPYSLYFRHPMTHTGDTKEKKGGHRTIPRRAKLSRGTAHNREQRLRLQCWLCSSAGSEGRSAGAAVA